MKKTNFQSTTNEEKNAIVKSNIWTGFKNLVRCFASTLSMLRMFLNKIGLRFWWWEKKVTDNIKGWIFSSFSELQTGFVSFEKSIEREWPLRSEFIFILWNCNYCPDRIWYNFSFSRKERVFLLGQPSLIQLSRPWGIKRGRDN